MSGEWDVTWEQMGVADAATLERFADASGDHNPIHLDEAKARAIGLPGVIAHGMLSAGWLVERGRRFVASRGGEPRLVRMKTRFKDMTPRGEAVACGGTALRTDLGWELQLSARLADGRVTTEAVLVFALS